LPKFSRLAAPAALLLLAAAVSAQTPTMDALWPNDDGRSWVYTQHYQNFVPPQIIDSNTRIFLDGSITAPFDIQAQYLRQQPATVEIGPALLASEIRDPFLRHVWVARPDLRGKLLRATAAGGATCPDIGPIGAYGVLLQGELAYRKTVDEVAAWRCNLADTRAWQWLVSDLTPGNTFTLQLIPDITSDVFLHGTIGPIESVTVPAGTYASCQRIDYVIDYGPSECRDQDGNVTGTYRSETHGYIDYAPGVGPVKTSEDFIQYVNLVGSCGSVTQGGETTWHVSLQLNSVATTPVRRFTWGRLKTVYR